jgi:hypothetical protein
VSNVSWYGWLVAGIVEDIWQTAIVRLARVLNSSCTVYVANKSGVDVRQGKSCKSGSSSAHHQHLSRRKFFSPGSPPRLQF